MEALSKIAKQFGMTIDQVVNFDGAVPQEVTVEDKTLLEQVKLIQELEPDEKNMVFKMVGPFLPRKSLRTSSRKTLLPYKSKPRRVGGGCFIWWQGSHNSDNMSEPV